MLPGHWSAGLHVHHCPRFSRIRSASVLPTPLPVRHLHTPLAHLGIKLPPSQGRRSPGSTASVHCTAFAEAMGVEDREPAGVLGGLAGPTPSFTPSTASYHPARAPAPAGGGFLFLGGAPDTVQGPSSSVPVGWVDGWLAGDSLSLTWHRVGRSALTASTSPLRGSRACVGSENGWSGSSTQPHSQGMAAGLGPAL